MPTPKVRNTKVEPLSTPSEAPKPNPTRSRRKSTSVPGDSLESTAASPEPSAASAPPTSENVERLLKEVKIHFDRLNPEWHLKSTIASLGLPRVAHYRRDYSRIRRIYSIYTGDDTKLRRLIQFFRFGCGSIPSARTLYRWTASTIGMMAFSRYLCEGPTPSVMQVDRLVNGLHAACRLIFKTADSDTPARRKKAREDMSVLREAITAIAEYEEWAKMFATDIAKAADSTSVTEDRDDGPAEPEPGEDDGLQVEA